jgi:hypothetical protein
VIGPFSFFGRTGSDADCSEHVFYYLVPTDFGAVADVEVKGQRRGKVTGLQLVEVRPPSKLNDFRDPDGDVILNREFNLAPGRYVRFAYCPDDAEAARYRPTTETVTVTLDDGRGVVTTSAPHELYLPALGVRRPIAWGPRSPSAIPSGSVDVTRLNAFAGSTYLPTGQVVFDVFATERTGDDELRFTIVQPAHGTVVAVTPPERTPSWAADEPDRRYVYTPDDAARIDPWVHSDAFVVRVDDGRGGMPTTVPVVIAKLATITGSDRLPYLGVESFSGRVSAPIGAVEGCVMVPSVFLAESVDSAVHYGSTSTRTAYGSVLVAADGSFTYTRDPRWELLPMEELDDSFALVARGADNQWATVVVPVGGAALVRYPSILDVLDTIATTRTA